jgi:putative transposase
MSDSVNNRISRGAIKKLTGNVNSCLSNKRNGHISHFQINYLSKKKSNEFLLYEDCGFPSWLKNIESRYWFTTKDKKRKIISFADVFSTTSKKRIEIIFDKVKDQFYLHYPVEINYFPPSDRRSDNQRDFALEEENRIISLDPGVRKFMVGYDPKGSLIYFGERANEKLKSLLLKIDKLQNNVKHKLKLWRKIKNLVSELHFKVISYLLKNYDTILLPEFKISGMIRGRKLPKITKRLLCMFSFHSFKEKMLFMSKRYNKKVVIVDESFTSQTCGTCGVLNKMGGVENYACGTCSFKIDRDVNGSRNIMIKNLFLR